MERIPFAATASTFPLEIREFFSLLARSATIPTDALAFFEVLHFQVT
jgi:hypothetical protein